MENTRESLNELSMLLLANGVGVERLTPRPRGGRLTGEPREEVECLLDILEGSAVADANLVYGNGCFAVGRYGQAAAVFERIVGASSEHLESSNYRSYGPVVRTLKFLL